MDLRQRVCDRCLGRRLIGAAGLAAQQEAARGVRTWSEVPEQDCVVCEGAFADASQWLRVAVEALAPYEFSTFQVGTRFPGPCEGAEKALSKEMLQEKLGETIRTEANRWLSAEMQKVRPVRPDPEGRPEVVVDVDTRYWTASAEANSVFVWGRYNKFRRDIPQTHWPCRRCEGRGCWGCNDTGVTYSESVEEAIGDPGEAAFAGSAYAFHGAGREDIDALMLGTGRPFVLEVKNPRLRSTDLDALAATINGKTEETGVGVRGLRMAAKEEVAAIKEGEYDKEYLATCVCERPVTRAEVEDVAAQLTGVTLEQRTPDRVSHRRADLVRRRTIHRMAVHDMPESPGTKFSITVLAESGTYIKETVSSDEGRTTPSVSGLLGVPCKVEALDVVAILDHKPKRDKADHENPTESTDSAAA